MTLCIAWREGQHVRLASDSRLSAGGSKVDIGIKVLDLPILIKSAVDNTTKESKVLYDYTAGLCWSGTSLSAYLFKETLAEILKHLQFAPFAGEIITFAGIQQIIAKYMKVVVEQLIDGLLTDMRFRFVLAGYCPDMDKIRAFKYEVEWTTPDPKINVMEILTNDYDIDYLGEGQDQAEKLIQGTINWKKILWALTEICKNGSVPSVGGEIQFGEFEDRNFQIKGVSRVEKDANGMLKPVNALRGLNIYDDSKLDVFPYHISYRLINLGPEFI